MENDIKYLTAVNELRNSAESVHSAKVRRKQALLAAREAGVLWREMEDCTGLSMSGMRKIMRSGGEDGGING